MAQEFPPELERRLAALESPSEVGEDFDANSWLWLLVLGVLVPIACTVVGVYVLGQS